MALIKSKLNIGLIIGENSHNFLSFDEYAEHFLLPFSPRFCNIDFSISSLNSIGIKHILIFVKRDKDIIADYLIKYSNGKIFCEIEPVDFFILGGVEVEDDIAHIPTNQFYCLEKNNIVVFKGYEPNINHYNFLSVILDIAQYHLNAKKIYTINGTISSLAYNAQRKILVVYNNQEFKEEFAGTNLVDMNW